MRQWQVEAAGEPAAVMHLRDAPEAPLRPGEIRVRVAASGIGLPDVLMCRGTYPLTPALPFTPGQEFAGVVTEAAPGSDVAPGARLMGVAAFMIGRGSFAQSCITYAPMAYAQPDGMDDATAACFTIGFHTAYLALARRAALRAGETVLVHGGAGGTGLAAITLAHALGGRVIATASTPQKAAICRDAGAELAIDLSAARDFVSAVDRHTKGEGAHVVFDPVGGEMFERSIDCTAPEGRILPIGFACGRWGVIGAEALAMRNISIVGALGGGFAREVMLDVHAQLIALWRAGKIAPHIDARIGFDEIAAGVQRVADRAVSGRIVALQ